MYLLKKYPSGFYVYAYIRDDGSPYYIGKGLGNRLYQKHSSNVALPKNRNKIVVLEENLTELGAWGRKDLGTGILHNRAEGGEGSTGAVVANQTRLKMSQSRKGKHHSIEHSANISKSSISKPGTNLGKSSQKKSRKKMSQSMKGRIPWNKDKTMPK